MRPKASMRRAILLRQRPEPEINGLQAPPPAEWTEKYRTPDVQLPRNVIDQSDQELFWCAELTQETRDSIQRWHEKSDTLLCIETDCP